MMLSILWFTMLCLEPIGIHGDASAKLYTSKCHAGQHLHFTYSLVSSGAPVLKFLLLSGLSGLQQGCLRPAWSAFALSTRSSCVFDLAFSVAGGAIAG